MGKTEKELAFLRDLGVDANWTSRFTDNFDKQFKFTDEKSIIYVNAGTGNHVLALREKLENDVEIFGVTENEELTSIASAKAVAIKANVEFSSFVPPDVNDLIVADASLIHPADLETFLSDVVSVAEEKLVFFLPTAGSFGEVFSVLWEVFLSDDLIDKSAEIERLIKEVHTVSVVEEMVKKAGLSKLKVKTELEVFEFENGEEFINSTLISDFLMPRWLDFLDQEWIAKVTKRLAKTIDENRDGLTFCFTVKATMIGGEKR